MPSADPVSLWWAPLDVADATDLEALLSPEERERARHLRDPADRARFVAARGWLRRLLAAELSCTPGDVRIVVDDRGKPSVAGSDLRYSASRSAGVALFATSWTMEVGVDVEAIRPMADVDAFAARFFSPTEQRALAALPPEERSAASFACWTRKEAYVKGTGDGITGALRALDVWTGRTAPMAVSTWTIHSVELGPDFAGAVAGATLGPWNPQLPLNLAR
ncbi:MAG TPA: 4'-phosphopantetheinyl transferase superfamily protein [Baekduia sp.]